MAATVRIVDAYCGNCEARFTHYPELNSRIPFEIVVSGERDYFYCGYCNSRNVLIATEPVSVR